MSEYIVEENPYPTYKVDGYSVRCDDWLIQRGEIVRCRVCRHFNGYHGKCHRQRGGVLIDDRSTRRLEDLGDVLVLHDAEQNGFCAWGERRDDE